MKTQTLHRIPTGLLLLGMIATLLFAMVFPQLVHASVLPATTCTEAAGVRTCDLWATTGTLTLPAGSVPGSSDLLTLGEFCRTFAEHTDLAVGGPDESGQHP